MEKWLGLFVVSVAGGMFFCSPAAAQVALSGAHYTQNFDTLGSGLPAGWSVWENASEVSLGETAAFETNTTSWAASTGHFRNCASVTNNSGLLATNASSTSQHAFTNRVLAVRQGSGFGDPGAAFVLQLANTTGLSNLQFSADFLMLDEESRESAWTVDYGIGLAPSAFVALGTHTNLGAPGTIVRSAYVLPSEAGDLAEVVTIRIVALQESAGSGSRDTFGLDNVRLSFDGAVAASIPLHIHRDGSDVVLSWGDPSFGLQAASSATGVYTELSGAVSPYTNAIQEERRYFRLIKGP